MSNASDIIDPCKSFTIAGQTLNFRRLGKLELLAIAENCVLQNEMRRIQLQAAMLDEKERLPFINACYDKLPNNAVLTSKAIELMNQESTQLILIMFKEAVVGDTTKEQFLHLLDNATPEELEMVSNHILSFDKKKL